MSGGRDRLGSVEYPSWRILLQWSRSYELRKSGVSATIFFDNTKEASMEPQL